MLTARLKYLLFITAISLTGGCSSIVDPIAVPLNNATLDLNKSGAIPFGTLPDTKFAIKNTGISLEKNF